MKKKRLDYTKFTAVILGGLKELAAKFNGFQKEILAKFSRQDQKILAVETKLKEKDQQIADLNLQNEALNAKLEHLDEEVSLIKAAQTKQLVSKMRSIDRSIASEK